MKSSFAICVAFVAIWHLIEGVPLRLQKRAAFYIANETACVVDHTVYSNGDPIPTDDPCEACKCRPPGFACVLKECVVKPGCRAVRRVGHCCPEYICGCEHNGRMYRDGDEIRDTKNPCYTCHCQGSSIACAFVDCFFRVDCAPEYVDGECCPHYNHCSPIESVPHVFTENTQSAENNENITSQTADDNNIHAEPTNTSHDNNIQISTGEPHEVEIKEDNSLKSGETEERDSEVGSTEEESIIQEVKESLNAALTEEALSTVTDTTGDVTSLNEEKSQPTAVSSEEKESTSEENETENSNILNNGEIVDENKTTEDSFKLENKPESLDPTTQKTVKESATTTKTGLKLNEEDDYSTTEKPSTQTDMPHSSVDSVTNQPIRSAADYRKSLRFSDDKEIKVEVFTPESTEKVIYLNESEESANKSKEEPTPTSPSSDTQSSESAEEIKESTKILENRSPTESSTSTKAVVNESEEYSTEKGIENESSTEKGIKNESSTERGIENDNIYKTDEKILAAESAETATKVVLSKEQICLPEAEQNETPAVHISEPAIQTATADKIETTTVEITNQTHLPVDGTTTTTSSQVTNDKAGNLFKALSEIISVTDEKIATQSTDVESTSQKLEENKVSPTEVSLDQSTSIPDLTQTESAITEVKQKSRSDETISPSLASESPTAIPDNGITEVSPLKDDSSVYSTTNKNENLKVETKADVIGTTATTDDQVTSKAIE